MVFASKYLESPQIFGVTRGISAKFPKSPPNNPRRSRGLFGGDEGNFDDIKRGGRYRSSHPKYHEAKPSGIFDDESGICPEFDIGHILRVSQVPEWAFVFIPLLWYFKGNYEDLGGRRGRSEGI